MHLENLKNVKKNEKTFCKFGNYKLTLESKGGAMWSGTTVVVWMPLHRSVLLGLILVPVLF